MAEPVTFRRVLIITGLLFLVLCVCLLVSIQVGTFDLDLSLALHSGDGEANPHRAVFIARLQRSLLAAVVGAGLSTVGTAFQALTRNPLADPFILGVSGGAAIGATLAIALGAGTVVLGTVTFPIAPIAAFIGAAASLTFVFRLSFVAGRLSIYRILLIGVVMNFFASAIIMVIKTLVGAMKVRAMLLWLVGTVSWATEEELWVAGLITITGIGYLISVSAPLNVASLGDEGAQLLGVDLARIRRRVFITCSWMVGAAVSVSGLIGFVGLIVPHALRQIVGPDHRILVPASALAGGAFLVVCDLATRALFPVLDTDAPVGVLTALVGGPAFIWLLLRGGHQIGEETN